MMLTLKKNYFQLMKTIGSSKNPNLLSYILISLIRHIQITALFIYAAITYAKDTQKNVINFTRTPAVMCFYDYYYYYCFLRTV